MDFSNACSDWLAPPSQVSFDVVFGDIQIRSLRVMFFPCEEQNIATASQPSHKIRIPQSVNRQVMRIDCTVLHMLFVVQFRNFHSTAKKLCVYICENIP